MKSMILTVFVALLACSPAFAQDGQNPPGGDGEIVLNPICSKLINRTEVTIQGSIETRPQTMPDGNNVRHTSNFKLGAGEKTDICASGPFYEGRRVILTIRTLIPLFSCKTTIDRDIFLEMKPQEDGTKQYWATCR